MCLVFFVGIFLVAAGTEEPVADSVDTRLAIARAEQGRPSLSRVPGLDAAAFQLANEIAARRPERRLDEGGSLRRLVERQGVTGLAQLTDHVDLQRGYADPASAVVERWQARESRWATALSLETTDIGLATATAEDGWLVFVAILGRRTLPAADLGDLDLRLLEAEIAQAVNQARMRQGRAPLVVTEALSEAARARSRDMAERHYFDTQSPEGEDLDGLLRSLKLGFSHAAGNIAKTTERENPVAPIVDEWMSKRGSRKHLLSRRFQKTGIGLDEDEEGVIYFTQVFVRP